jgi:plasmid stabilization system protein ParE
MSVRYVLAPEAEVDLEKADVEIADRVEAVIRQKIDFLARNPGSGHSRNDLTDEPARFFPVFVFDRLPP